jgi:hypothetical protein
MPRSMAIILFVVTGGFAIVMGKSVMEYLPYALQDMSLNDCTFCATHTVRTLWSAVVIAGLMALIAICCLILAAFPSKVR